VGIAGRARAGTVGTTHEAEHAGFLSSSPPENPRISFGPLPSPQPFGRSTSAGVLPPHQAPHAAPVTYRERLGGYLHPRDMRRLVTPFSASNEPELIVRRHVILLNFDPLRAVVLRDRLLVLGMCSICNILLSHLT